MVGLKERSQALYAGPMATLIVAAGVTALQLLAQGPPSPAPDSSAAFSQSVGPFIRNNCQGCHNAGLPSGNVDLQAVARHTHSLAVRHDNWENDCGRDGHR